MNTIEVGSTTLLVQPIELLPGMTRRQAERATVASMLREHFGYDVVIERDTEGAPHISECHISISHSRLLAVVALDRHKHIGVDAEEWRNTLLRVSCRFLSPQEQDLFTSPHQLLAAWTIKEAVYKVAGPETVDLASAITITPEQKTAYALGVQYTVWSTDIQSTHISLVK